MKEEEIKQIYVDLGSRIRVARERMGFSQEILAEQLDLTRASVVNIEGGRQRPMLHTIIKIAQILHQPLEYLLPYTTEDQEAEPEPLVAAGTEIDTAVSELEVDDATKEAVLQFFLHSKK